jgi:YHS domain-containing protein
MRVDRAKALTLEHGGHTVYFCGEGCRQRFRSG